MYNYGYGDGKVNYIPNGRKRPRSWKDSKVNYVPSIRRTAKKEREFRVRVEYLN